MGTEGITLGEERPRSTWRLAGGNFPHLTDLGFLLYDRANWAGARIAHARTKIQASIPLSNWAPTIVAFPSVRDPRVMSSLRAPVLVNKMYN